MNNARYQKMPSLPISQESNQLDLKVDDVIPPELDGIYVRNGPNPVGEISSTQHYFSGHGMVHGGRLSEGRALWYRNQIVRAGDVSQILGEFAPGRPIAHGIDVSPNTNVAAFGDRLYTT